MQDFANRVGAPRLLRAGGVGADPCQYRVVTASPCAPPVAGVHVLSGAEKEAGVRGARGDFARLCPGEEGVDGRNPQAGSCAPLPGCRCCRQR